MIKSHPILARNDSSKKRRKAKLFEISLPSLAPTIPVKKEKEDDLLHLSASKSVKVEKDKVDTTRKLLVLNRSSTSPLITRNKSISSESVSAISSTITTSSRVKVFSRESTVAAIVANKRGSNVKNNDTYASGRSDYSATNFDSRSAQNLESSDDGSRQLMFSKDSRKVLPVGRCGVEATLVDNPWTRGRCNELLNGLKVNISKTPPQSATLNPSPDPNVPTSSTSIVRPQVVRQPTGAERVGNAVGEEDDLEVRRLKARSKNEKKHLQRAARAREKREAEEAAAVQAATSAASTMIQTEYKSKQYDSDTNFKPWSESITSVLRQHKFQSLAKQLQEYGFFDWQSNLALRMCGSDVEQCLDWLLRNEPSMQKNVHVHHEQKMDITSEMNVLKEVVVSEGFSQEQVELAVISTDGDIDAALKVLRTLSSYCNFSQESSQGFLHNIVSSHHSFSQPPSQNSSDLVIGEGAGMLNGTADGQNFSPLSWSVTGSHSQSSFGPFAGGFISDLARYHSYLGLDDLHSSGNTRPIIGSQFGECRDQSQLQRTISISNTEYHEAVSGGLCSHPQNSYESTASTVTSVATAVLKDTFGFDEQMISRMTDVIAVNETPLSSIGSAVPWINGIWSYPSSSFTSFAANKGITNMPSADSFSYNSTLDGKSSSNSPFGVFGELPFGVHSDPTRDSAKNCFSKASPTYASRWEQQDVKLVDEAEEQDRLMSELLSQLLV